MTHAPLANKMLALANSGHARAEELRIGALALDAALLDVSDVKKMLGCWARARKLWSECSGEPLL